MAIGGELDAIVIATDPRSRVRIAGLTACERAVRVARRVGAARVCILEGTLDPAWRHGRTCPLLVIRADQLVHTPLVEPLLAAIPAQGATIAVVCEDPPVGDLTVGAYAGAFVVAGAAVDEILAALEAGETDATAIAKISDAARIPHGPIARAPIGTPDERRAAHRLLYRILVKPQDNAITRYLYRPVSFPLTRLLVWTPITPNQISYLVAILVAVGCWVTAQPSLRMAVLGTAIVLAASYIDCCDGEVARVKLLSSRLGAWLDTVVDELSSVGYMVAIGWHCHLAFPEMFSGVSFDVWQVAIAVSVVTFLSSIYCIYYNIIVAVGSANSQDYVGRFEIVPGSQPSSVRLRPAAAKAIVVERQLPAPVRWLATYAPYLVRRDFISWGALVLVAVGLEPEVFGLLVAGGLVTFVIVTIDHLKLRSLRRAIARRGQILEAP